MKVRERKDDGQGWQHAISGAAAGMTASVITCPFDVVKARMQSQRGTPTSQSYQGTFRSLLNIWKKEGIRGWYRGFNITMGSYLPNWTIYFTAYHETKLFLADEYSWDLNHPSNHVASAVTAGMVCLTLMNPIWVVRTRLMVQMKEETAFYYRNSLDAFKTIYQQEGLKGFYRGFLPSLWGTLHVAIQFPLYEYLKRECPHWMDSPNNRISDDNGKYLTLVLISSVLSKLVASTVTYPHEVIRTRSQVYTAVIVAAATTTHDQPLGRTPTMRQIIKMIYRENGIQGFYRGLTTNFIRVLPASGITFVTYEFLLHQLQSLSQSQSRVGYKL